MWIVTLPNGTRHSAWNSKREAKRQADVCYEHGMGRDNGRRLEITVEYDDTVHCENGHYYV